MDTGSSDLWLKADSPPLANSQQTVRSILHNLHISSLQILAVVNHQSYRKHCHTIQVPLFLRRDPVRYWLGVRDRFLYIQCRVCWVRCHLISRSRAHPLICPSITVAKQAYLDVTSANNPALSYNADGLIGLGFTSLSTVDSQLNKTGASDGRSLLYNLFEDNPDEKNFMAFSFQRSTDSTDDVQGGFSIGRHYLFCRLFAGSTQSLQANMRRIIPQLLILQRYRHGPLEHPNVGTFLWRRLSLATTPLFLRLKSLMRPGTRP